MSRLFAHLTERAAAAADARAGRRRERIAARLRAAALRGAAVHVDGEDVVIEGGGLGRRLVTDAALRWQVAEAIDGR